MLIVLYAFIVWWYNILNHDAIAYQVWRRGGGGVFTLIWNINCIFQDASKKNKPSLLAKNFLSIFISFIIQILVCDFIFCCCKLVSFRLKPNGLWLHNLMNSYFLHKLMIIIINHWIMWIIIDMIRRSSTSVFPRNVICHCLFCYNFLWSYYWNIIFA